METNINNGTTESINGVSEPNNATTNVVTTPDNSMEKGTRSAVAGLVLGLVSIIGWFIPLFGFPLTILAIIFSARGLSSAKRKQAIAGLVLGIVFFIVTLMNSIVGAIMGALSAM